LHEKIKLFIIVVLILVILFIFPIFLSGIENYALNFAIRSLLILIVVYLILIMLKYLRK
jgi:hypothetical protein